MNIGKECELYDNKICDGCGECDRCDLNPEKVCDNCEKCLQTDVNYKIIKITKIIEKEQ